MKSLAYILTGALTLALLQAPAHAQPGSESQASPPQGNPYKAFRHSTPDDKAFAKSVWKHVAKMKGLDLADVSIIAKNGDILITGRVSDSEQIQKIGAAVQGTPGVRSVVNNLVVWPVRPD